MIYKLYKHKNKIICYIVQNKKNYIVCTGKPSDASCLSWQYKTIFEAIATADEYFKNYLKSIDFLRV